MLWSELVKLAYSPSFITLAFQKRLEYCNANGCVNSSNGLAMFCKYLVNFGLVILEFTRVICIHTTSISSGISLAMFAMQRHCRHCVNHCSVLFHSYLLGGDTAMPHGLHTRLCHTFLVLEFAQLILGKIVLESCQATRCASQHIWCLSQARINWEGSRVVPGRASSVKWWGWQRSGWVAVHLDFWCVCLCYLHFAPENPEETG